MLPDANGKIRAGVLTMFATAPIKSADGKKLLLTGPAHRAGEGFHAHLGDGAFWRDRRDVCVRA